MLLQIITSKSVMTAYIRHGIHFSFYIYPKYVKVQHCDNETFPLNLPFNNMLVYFMNSL